MTDTFTVSDHRVLERAVRTAGAAVRSFFGAIRIGRWKNGPNDPVTKADLASERILLRALRRHFPDIGIVSEESGASGDPRRRFVIDPLDGTLNFLIGVPQFSISVAFVEDDQLVSGLVYHPMLDRLYRAGRGAGAWCGSRRLHVGAIRSTALAAIAYSEGYAAPTPSRVFPRLLRSPYKRIMTNWSPALDHCLVADGRLEAIVSFRNELYDFAAGKLIAAEAGASIVDWSGRRGGPTTDSAYVAACTPMLARAVSRSLTGKR